MAKKEEKENLIVKVPRTLLSDEELARLKEIVKSKEALIKKATGSKTLKIEVSDKEISFPWFTQSDDSDAGTVYAAFVICLCNLARSLKRVNQKESGEVENEKYAFRCFLLRLGLIGPEHKEERRILLKNFTGSSAFKSGAKKAQ